MAPTLSDQTASIHSLASALQPNNETQRLTLLDSARALVRTLEKPHERIMRMCYHDHALYTATKILGDLHIFRLIVSSPSPITAEALAEQTKASKALIERLLKHIATEQFVEEVAADTYIANAFTRVLATEGAKGAVDDTFQLMPVFGAFPAFLESTSYVNPIDKDHSAFKYGLRTDQHFFEYVNAPGHEDKLLALRRHMAFKTVGQRWFDVSALMDAMFAGFREGEEGAVRLVDVGGSGGDDLMAFRAAHGGLPGRLVLQDLPTTIAALDGEVLRGKGIETMGHDFFTEQPVKGAKVYYLKMVLHDWPDEQCRAILGQLRPAMERGYSRILLDEIVVPDQGAGWFETSVDLLMMQVHSAQERREREWRTLVDGAPGLKVKKIWDLEGAVNKVIEIEAV